MPTRVEQFQALVARQPRNELFRFSLAQSLLEAQRPAEAIPHLEICVQSKADWMIPRIILAKLLLADRRTEEARPLLESALRLAIDQDHVDPAAEVQVLLASL
ncbi:MAG: tetratricopeptide repeat protein [Opitutales bacterium]